MQKHKYIRKKVIHKKTALVCASSVVRDKLALHSLKALWSSSVQAMG
jgi:hypothetical protein